MIFSLRFLFCFLIAAAMPLSAQPVADPLTLTLNKKDFVVEVVRSPEEWARGLMHRKDLPQNQGMLFVGQIDREQSFWMKNTLIPLDIIFIDSDWKIVSISESPETLSERPRRSEGPARHVLEINAGLSQRWHFKKGMRVELGKALKKFLRNKQNP